MGSLGLEDEVGSDTDERERLGERDTDPHQNLEAASELRLASSGLTRSQETRAPSR